MTTLMLAEAREAPARVAAALQQDRQLYAEIGKALRQTPPTFIATVARGSSDHAATYAAALFGILTGRVTATLPPSLVTRYAAKLHLAGALVLGLSQSGASPDLLAVMRQARTSGASTLAIVNAKASPLAEAAEWSLPQRAGAEQAVAATKSVILSMVVAARLAAAWAGDHTLGAAIENLPERLEAALACDWSPALPLLADPTLSGLYTVARGVGLGVAQEAALKLKETSNLHAEAVSAAEIQHGPRAVIDGKFPLLVFALEDPAGADARTFGQDLAALGAPVMLASHHPNAAGLCLPLPPPLHPLLDPIPALLAFYPFAEALSRARNLNPDHPRGLTKITRTV